MGYVFVSYSRRDIEYADRLVEHLQSAGIETWIDRGAIAPGARYRRVVRDAISDCDALILLMTPEAEESDWVEDELDWARQHGKPLFPLLLAGNAWFGFTAINIEDVSNGALPQPRFLNALPTSRSEARSVQSTVTAQPEMLRSTHIIEGVSVRTLEGHTGRVFGCAVAPDGSYAR